MGLPKLKTKISVEDYLEGEKISPVRHEYTRWLERVIITPESPETLLSLYQFICAIRRANRLRAKQKFR